MASAVNTGVSLRKVSKPETPQNGILARRRSVGLNFPVLPSRSGSPLICHSRSASPVTNPRYRRISAQLPLTAAAETQTSPTRSVPVTVPPSPMARKTARPRSRSRSGREVLQTLCSSARKQLARVRRAASRDRGVVTTKRQRLSGASSEECTATGLHKGTDTSVSGLVVRQGENWSEAQREGDGMPTVQLLELRPDGSRIISLRRPEGAAFGFFVVQDSAPPNAFRVTRLVSAAVERRYGALFGVGSEILEVEASPSGALTMPDLLARVSERTSLRLRVKSTEFLL